MPLQRYAHAARGERRHCVCLPVKSRPTARRAAEKREAMPDAKHGDRVVSKFMNVLMYDGKKSVAEHIVYGAFEQIQKKTGQDPIKVFHDALSNVKPDIEVRSTRVAVPTSHSPVA